MVMEYTYRFTVRTYSNMCTFNCRHYLLSLIFILSFGLLVFFFYIVATRANYKSGLPYFENEQEELAKNPTDQPLTNQFRRFQFYKYLILLERIGAEAAGHPFRERPDLNRHFRTFLSMISNG